MSSLLQPTRPLNGFDHTWGETRLYEPAQASLLSLAVPKGADADFTLFLKQQWNLELPTVGRFHAEGETCLLRLAEDQCFLQLPFSENPISAQLGEAAEGKAYLTDQSDGWAQLILEGPGALATLERLCMIDLHPEVFAVGCLARTLMEHLNVLIYRHEDEAYTLMSARSSAASFLHAVTTSLDHTQ